MSLFHASNLRRHVYGIELNKEVGSAVLIGYLCREPPVASVIPEEESMLSRIVSAHSIIIFSTIKGRFGCFGCYLISSYPEPDG